MAVSRPSVWGFVVLLELSPRRSQLRTMIVMLGGARGMAKLNQRAMQNEPNLAFVIFGREHNH